MDVRRRLHQGLARQLGHPGGFAGRLVGQALNRGNRSAVAGAVDALSIVPGAELADVGFGGGVGLALLLARNGDGAGTVHGVEVSAEMLRGAERRFRSAIAGGRLVLHEAPITAMPFGTATLDGLVTTNTIYFVDDLDGACAEIARVLKQGGRAAIGIGDPEAMAEMPFTPYGFRLRPLDEVIAALARAGLALVDHRRIGGGRRPFHVLVAAPAA